MDRLFYHGKAVAMTGTVANAVGVTDGRITFVGSDAEGLLLADAHTDRVDLQGGMLLPGFIDTHMHMTMFGERLENVDLSKTKTRAELIEAGRAYLGLHPETGILIGSGWNNDHWDDSRFPTKAELDGISKDIPVVYERVCGHVVCVNTKALELAKITEFTPDPEGGEIARDERGDPTGVLKENAVVLAFKLAPKLTREIAKRRIALASKEAVQCGLTTVHSDDLSDFYSIDPAMGAYRELIFEDALPLRIVEQARLHDEAHLVHFLDLGLTFGKGDSHFRIGPLKLIGDGSLGAGTAFMTRPYADNPNTRGLACYTEEELTHLVLLAATHAMPCAVHAIGDATIDMVLNAIEAARKVEKTHLRHAIVHLQITRPDQLLRMKALDVMALTQPIFLDYDLHIADSRVGDLARTSYAFHTLQTLGVHQAFGSDCPVEWCSVLHGLKCAVTRQDHDNLPAGGWYPKERMRLIDALACFTRSAAYASGEERVKGTLEVGKYADLVVLDTDLFAIDPQDIDKVRVVHTIMGGKTVYQA